jgi:putative aldouronate transport system substrate-binding protein
VWGFQFRKDWLDKAGLSVPTNINEWYTVLKALKAAHPEAVPFTCRRSLDQYGLNTLTGAFGVHYGWYNDNGTIKYGPAQPEYQEYLTTMAQWYKEGLIDPDFPLNDGTAVDAKILAGGAGGWVGLLMGGMGRYLQTAKAQGDMTFDVVGAPFPTDLKTGQAYDFLLKNEAYFGTAITTANKYPVETIKLLDYAFSAEGAQLLSYGIEGKTFTMVNGRPTFTDEILKNPQGWVIDNALAHYARTCATFIWFINDPWAQVQRMLYPQQEEAAKIWSLGTTVRTLPMLNPQENEVDTFASDMNQIQTYADEMFVKFIMGQEPLSNFPRYVANLNNMNIARVTDIQQRAYQRYSTRAID